MAASVTVHHKAFSDPRIALLAKLLGVDFDSAGFKMARLWSVCTELRTDRPPAEHIRACMLSELGDDALVRCGLGERMADGSIRVRGRKDDNGDDRLDWYGDLQDRSATGGKKRAATAVRDSRGRMLPRSQNGSSAPATDQPRASSSQESDPDPRSDLPERESEEITSVRVDTDATPDPLPTQQSRAPRPAERPEDLQRPENNPAPPVTNGIASRVWSRLEKLRAAIAADLGLEVRPLHPMDPGSRDLAHFIRESRGKGLADERIESDLNHALDVLAAEARRDRSVQWLTGSAFAERCLRRALGMTVADVTAKAKTNGTHYPGADPPPPRRVEWRDDTTEGPS